MNSKPLLRLACRSGSLLSKIRPGASSVALPSRGFSGGRGSQDHRAGYGVGLALGAGAAAAVGLSQAQLIAEADEDVKDVLDTENRIRQYSKSETIFDYFASYQCINSKGKKTTLMSASDFYNAVTPGSTLSHGTGRGVYTQVTLEEIHSEKLYDQEKIPMDGLLNKIQRNGLLSYIDFIFLTYIMATPRRYMDIAFHAFDISADGNVEAREFVHVMAKIVSHKGDPEDLLKENMSGLLPAIFGKDMKTALVKEDFLAIQEKLIDEMLYLEYSTFDKESKNSISEVDFCRNILYNANLPSKKKERMVRRVEKAFGGSKSRGISFDQYRTFYHLLFGGSDLERAMFFLDTESEREGVNQAEFTNIAKWVLGGNDVDHHVVNVIFTLLDEDGDKNLSVKEFVPVMFQWRNKRGFDKASVQVSLGQLRI